MEKRGEGEPLSHPLEPEPEPQPAPPGEKRFRLWYVGSSCLDRRTTLPMLPWLVAEIRRRGQRQEPCGAPGSGVPAREVLLLLGSPTLRCVHDLTYFAYLIKAQPDNPDSPMACHVFRATDPNQASGGRGRGRSPGSPRLAPLLSWPDGTPGAPQPWRGRCARAGQGAACGALRDRNLRTPTRGAGEPARGRPCPPDSSRCAPPAQAAAAPLGSAERGGGGDTEPCLAMGCIASPCQAGVSASAERSARRHGAPFFPGHPPFGVHSSLFLGSLPSIFPIWSSLNILSFSEVPDVISSIRQVSKAALKEDAKPSKESEDAFYDSQKFEVLYCGKVTVAHKKAPSTLIDDCIEKFSLHERQRLKLLNEQRNNESSLDLPLCEENVPASPLDSPFEELDSPNSTPTAGRAAMFTIGSQTNLTNLASTRGFFPERILEDSGFDEQQEFRSRCSSVTAVMQRRVHDTNLKAQSRRRHASAPSHVQPSDSEKNRTMLFQVGRFEVNLISPDTKSVVFEKNFKDISSCSQGIKHVDHFGFICRESVEGGLSQYICYVFQCASESLVDEVMLTLKQAFSTAAALQNAKTQIKLCEACPMHSLHKLCERIEGLYPPRAKLVIQRHLSSLTDNEQADIFERVQKMKPENDQEENELVILHLRQLCETKQKTHIHIGEAPSVISNSAIPEGTTSGGRFKLDILKNKAKKSLTSSLENIFSRGANRMRGRLGSVDSFERCSSLAPDRDTSPGDSPPATPPASPVSSAWQTFPEEGSDSPQFRRRAHTFSHPPSSARRRITFQNGRSQSARSPLLRQNGLEAASDGEGKKRTSTFCSSESLNAAGATLTPRRISWRRRIFLQVASPMNKSPSKMQHPDGHDGSELLPLSPLAPPLEEDPLVLVLQNEDGPDKTGERKNSEELQSLWRKAIHQQILLLRMEKENQKLEG
uniref:TBC1 domain family member 4 n=1 Tax=Agelaius phoeniceus TaxID=39638 RepID=UPI0023ED6D32|nr:TBC1 domain family member 4 [Agelaius phoeniceus]